MTSVQVVIRSQARVILVDVGSPRRRVDDTTDEEANGILNVDRFVIGLREDT